MGAACCVAARDRTIPDRSSREIVYRSVRYSPSWSFRWDNRGRVAGEIETSLSSFSDGVSRSNVLETKTGTHENSPYISEVGSPLESLQTPISQKSPASEDAAVKSCSPPSADQSVSRSVSFEVKESIECPAVSDAAPTKQLPLAPSTSSVSASPLSSKVHLPPAGSTPSKWPNYSPGHQMLRQMSDGRTRGVKSPNYSVSEGRPSLMLPAWSNESTRASHGGSSDSWSMQAFSELMVTSQRERWSFDSESLCDKITRSSSRKSATPSVDLQTCGVCSKLLSEKSSWSSQKIIANNELSVVSVLICGHVYHAECLETMTPEISKYDPACPICTFGEKQTLKLCEKALKAEIEYKAKANKRSRNRVVDSDFDGDFIKSDHHKNKGHEGKGPKMGSSSSMKSSFAKPFLKRHFSVGSKGTKSFSENHAPRKKGFFWTRSSRE